MELTLSDTQLALLSRLVSESLESDYDSATVHELIDARNQLDAELARRELNRQED